MKTLTKEKAAQLRDQVDCEINRLNIDASRAGVSLSKDQRLIIANRLKRLLVAGADKDKVILAIRNKLEKWLKYV